MKQRTPADFHFSGEDFNPLQNLPCVRHRLDELVINNDYCITYFERETIARFENYELRCNKYELRSAAERLYCFDFRFSST